jgi:hypothetical protein
VNARAEGLLHARGAAAARKAGGEGDAEYDGDYEVRARRVGCVEMGVGKTLIRAENVQMTKLIQARVPKSDCLQLPGGSDVAVRRGREGERTSSRTRDRSRHARCARARARRARW